MQNFILLSLLCFLITTTTYSQGLDDPFSQVARGGQSVDAAAMSSAEIPAFKKFVNEQKEFNAPHMLPTELETLRASGERMFVLDSRSKEEYNISHIAGAKRVGFEDFTSEKVWMLNREYTIIVYCAAGQRSKYVAQYLQMMGFVDVYVLEGSLINWSNTGHEVIDAAGNVTDKIHVFNKDNARLLKGSAKSVW
ncbi:MAG: rhodanese-like domain-containing protein [Aureispira sp.]|nr:rhodanese-like domain-containing protein [Aureispira sp.]